MYYPEQRPIAEMMRIRRRTLLPDYAIGNVRAELGSIVDVRETVARGLVPAQHVLIEAAQELGLRNWDELPNLLLAELRRPIQKGAVIAGRDPERGRRIFAPFDGLIIYVGEGRIVMQAIPEIIDLEAGVRGQVIEVIEGRGVVVEATGGVIQGIWGNDQHVIATLRFEPRKGIESISADDLDTTYRGDIVITHTPITSKKINIALAQSFAGIVAPSMDASLIDKALNSDLAIMLTTGFGDGQFVRSTLNILEEYDGFQAVLDAALPKRFDDRRAELVINQMSKEDLRGVDSIALHTGMTVRITRAPYAGRNGRVVALPANKVKLPNGLRVSVAQIEIGVDEIIDVPLANLEVAGI